MRRHRPLHNTTSLPRNLREELGLKDTYGQKKRAWNGPGSRKADRKAERSDKRTQPSSRLSNHGRQRHENDDDDHDSDGDLNGFDDLPDGDEQEDGGLAAIAAKVAAAKSKEKGTGTAATVTKKKKKKKKKKKEDVNTPENDNQPVARKVPETVKAKLAEDDAEIAALEKRLGIKKGKKLPKAFQEDGLNDILGDLAENSGDESRKRKREADDWLRNKRRKAQGQMKSEDDSDDGDMDTELDEEFDSDDDLGSEDEDLEATDDDDDLDVDDEDASDDGSEGGFEGFDDSKSSKKDRENPYVAPVTKPPGAPSGKYIPPSLRAASADEGELMMRLRRQAQGHLNKLSEANLISILGEIEKLYREYPRQNVTSTLINLLFGLIGEPAALQDTFIVLHAGFIAAIYKVIGMDFGAELVQKIVESFDAGGDERGEFQGKQSINLISLLSQLYNFHVVGSTLMFDYIRIFAQDITETNTELLLKIIRNCGPQLRQDDPSSLKDIVLLIQPAVAKIGEANLSVRTKFMIETITDLKNNRVKAGVGSSVTSEHITKMRKILGSLNNSRVLRATEPIRISRTDIHNSSKKGKWWLVGASWKEDPLESAYQELSGISASRGDGTNGYPVEDDSEAEPDLVNIAKAHRMNTDVRRSIFVAIMSASDYQDAHVRLGKLRLKRAQEFEIPRVLVHCAMEEEAYNPYYTLIARRLCGDMGRRIKVSFMYTLWNMFKKMGERDDLDDPDGEDDFAGFDDDDAESGPGKLTTKAIVNLSKMYGSLVADGTLTLSIVKTLNFAYLQPKTRTFMELFIITIIQQSQKKQTSKKSKSTKSTTAGGTGLSQEADDGRDERALTEIFLRTRDTPQVVKGLIFFLRKVVAKTDIVASDQERKLVKWGCRVAVDALTDLSSDTSGLR